MKHLLVCIAMFFAIGLVSACDIFGTKDFKNQSIGLKGYNISDIYANNTYTIAAPTSTNSFNYIFRSNNNGLSWNSVDSIHVVASSSHPGIINSHEVNIAYVKFISDGSYLFAGIGGEYSAGLYVSTDNGKTWARSDSSFAENINCFTKIGKTIFAGTSHGVFLSSNYGTNWNAAGLNDAVTGLTMIRDTLFAATAGNGLFCSNNNGVSWNKVYDGNFGFEGGVLTTGDNVLIGASSPIGKDTVGGVLVSSDLGKNWRHSNSGLADNNVNVLHSYGSYILAGTSSGVYVSKNDGSSWSFLSNGSPNDSLPVFSFSTNDSYLFVGTNNGIWRYPLSKLN